MTTRNSNPHHSDQVGPPGPPCFQRVSTSHMARRFVSKILVIFEYTSRYINVQLHKRKASLLARDTWVELRGPDTQFRPTKDSSPGLPVSSLSTVLVRPNPA